METSPSLFPLEQWTSVSFLVEIKPRTDFASLFVSCPKELTTSNSSDVEPFGLIRLEEQMLELAIDPQKPSSSGSEDEHENEHLAIKKKKLSTKFSDILLDPATICSISWADQQQEILMCKVRAEADYVSFAPKTIKRLGEELVQMCHLPEYVERVERSKCFEVKCAQCGQQIHSHSKSDFEFGILPNDDWLELSPQLDYFCGQSGSECCAKQLEKDTAVQHLHHNEGILGFSGGFSPESTRHWLPGERKIVFSNSFLLFHKNKALETALTENQVENCATILTCAKCQVQLGTALKGRPHILKLYMSVLDVHGDGRQRISYILSRFRSMECFLAWMLLNKCEHQASMKLLIRSLDRAPQLLVWLLEPYVLLTRGVLREAPEAGASPAGADTSSISFPALKILYKLFDADTSKQDPRANGGDSSVGILDVPMGCCLQFTETLLQSSLALPPPLRALGQFFVGFIQLKDRVD